MSGDINLKEFKEQVLGDYRTAFLGREMRRSASKDTDCHFVTGRSDVAQVALSRAMSESDAFVSAGLDLTASLSMGKVTEAEFFKSIFSSAYDVFSHGSPSSLSVAVGMALADAATGNKGADGRRRVITCTAGGDFGADGDFLEAVCYAAARSLPLAIVLWNNNGTTSNGNLIRQLSGFGMTAGGRKTLVIEAAKGGDYAALCRVMRQQVEAARGGCTTLTFVSGAEADVESFGRWIEEKQIATRAQIDEVEKMAKTEVERQRRGAYLTSLVADTPMRHPHRSLLESDDLWAGATRPVMRMPSCYGAINKAIGVATTGLLPVVEASAAEVSASSIGRYPEAEVIVRSTEIEVGAFLSSTSEKTEVYTPVARAEAIRVYADLASRPRQAVVIEPGFEERESETLPTAEPHATRITIGEDVTLVSFGLGTRHAADAARLLEAQQLRVDLIHLGSLRPLDPDGLVTASVRKTKRLAIVDTDPSGLTARLIIAGLSVGSEAMRFLLRQPVIVKPQSSLKPAEPHDICMAVVNLVG